MGAKFVDCGPVIVTRNQRLAYRPRSQPPGNGQTRFVTCDQRFAPSKMNQTGIEIIRPDCLPMTLILIWRQRERRSLGLSLEPAILTSI